MDNKKFVLQMKKEIKNEYEREKFKFERKEDFSKNRLRAILEIKSFVEKSHQYDLISTFDYSNIMIYFLEVNAILKREIK